MEPDYEFWPDGCSIRAVDDCGGGACEYCQRLLDELAEREAVAAGQEPATADGDASLAAFAAGQADD
ncbi:hypothetical protein AMR74_16530 [Halorubrum tropicale]|uniref:Uncharacterized protein n=2 Tax=Halorubrum tropicale TaxID=1765655 RepID=A0A0M9AKE4_9EURY|nr:hypothetical protein AMR74_16530 [Halorubrum tropicale]